MSTPAGFNLKDISDVRIAGVRNGDSLTYRDGLWVPGVAGATPVAVTADWATAANAKTDIETATGMTFPADTALDDIFVTLWEGPGDADDFAVLLVKDTPSYTAPNGETAEFASAPASGVAYIIGFTINKVIA